ncbi:MAG: hypothetical protein ABI286_08540 [Edaphobacter sp.]
MLTRSTWLTTSKFILGWILSSAFSAPAQVNGDLTTLLASPNKLSVQIANRWSSSVDALIVDGSVRGISHVRGFYDALYNFKHDTVVPHGQLVVVNIPVIHSTVGDVGKFNVSCVIFEDGSSIGELSCVNRVRRRRQDLLIALTDLKEILQRNAASKRTTSDLLQDIGNIHPPKNQGDPDSSSASAMARNFGIANIKRWTNSLGGNPSLYISRLLVVCDEWRNNLIAHPSIR